MDKIKKVIGIDPDVEKNGVAVYENKKLVALRNLKFTELCEFILNNKEAVYAIENVMDITATFKKQYATTQGAVRKVSYSVGRNAQVGYHLIDFLDHHHIPYKLLPIAKHWKKQQETFKRFTGWSGRSNEETRSAAYFGFLVSQ
jgi:hypothetical protein